ncbi:MAG: TolC family protein [Chlamydiae bacterium]|nr:TolC family protein [Chlamydiota bacterium]
MLKRNWYLLFFLMGCKPPPEVSPQRYAPESNASFWITSKADKRHIDAIPFIDLSKLENQPTMLGILDLFQLGLSNSPLTKKTFYDAQSAASNYGIARSALYPDIKINFQYLRQLQGFQLNNTLFKFYTTTYGPEVILNYALIDLTRQPNIESNYFLLLTQNLTHNVEIQKVLKNVADSYYVYLYQKNLLIAYQSDLVDAQATYTAAIERLQLGISDLTNVMQAKSVFLQKKINVVSQEAILKNALITLNTTLGVPGQTNLNVEDFPDPKTIQNSLLRPDELLTIAQSMRPDLKAIKTKILQRKADLKKAFATNYPQLTLRANGGQYWFNQGFTDQGNWNVTFNLDMPIFTGWKITNNCRQQLALIEEAESSLNLLQLQVISGVMTEYNNLVAALDQLNLSQQYLGAAEIDYKGTFEGYKAGTNDILDVLNAQASLADARAKLVQIVSSYFQSKANLTFEIGTINKNEAP